MGILGHEFPLGDALPAPAAVCAPPPTVWARLQAALLDLVFPRRCGGCNRPGLAWCDVCRAQTRPVGDSICPRCGRPQPRPGVCPPCRHTPIEIDGIRSAVMFEGPVRKAIHHLKYTARTSLAEPLGAYLIEYWQTHPLPADLLIPVPLHAARSRERGYNQSTLLARQLARAAALPVREPALQRVKATVPQVTLNAAERKANVHEAFTADAGLVQGQRALLIDDVCTTGSTLEACSRALKQAGAAAVWALTLGRAPG